jgi:hypothetical protein
VLRDNLKSIEPSDNSADLAYLYDSKRWHSIEIEIVYGATAYNYSPDHRCFSAAMDEAPGICSMSQFDQMSWLILHLYKTFLLCSLLAIASAEMNCVVKY